MFCHRPLLITPLIIFLVNHSACYHYGINLWRDNIIRLKRSLINKFDGTFMDQLAWNQKTLEDIPYGAC